MSENKRHTILSLEKRIRDLEEEKHDEKIERRIQQLSIDELKRSIEHLELQLRKYL